MALAASLVLAACRGSAPLVEADKPSARRIVSLDFCADQYVLKFADRDRILALSPDAVKDFSYMKKAAAGLPEVAPKAEDVLILKPDLVVRSYGGGPKAIEFFERAGVPVLNVGWAAALDGDGAGSVPDVIRKMAIGLGAPERGEAVIAEYNKRLAAMNKRKPDRTALYMTPTGITTGPGSLVHEMIVAAGYENYQTEPGWRAMPLERLVYDKPDIIAGAFYDGDTSFSDNWAVSRHPVARKLMRDGRVVELKGAWTSCGGWFAMEAVEALARENREDEE